MLQKIVMKKILLMIGILSLSSLCFAEGKPDASDEVNLSIIKLKI